MEEVERGAPAAEFALEKVVVAPFGTATAADPKAPPCWTPWCAEPGRAPAPDFAS
jgi:hypothetical protein